MGGDTQVYGYLRAVEHGLTDTQHAVLAVLARGDRRVEVDPRAGRVSHRMRAELLVVEMEALDRMADEQRRFDDREWLTKLYWHSAPFWPEGRSRLGWSPPRMTACLSLYDPGSGDLTQRLTRERGQWD